MEASQHSLLAACFTLHSVNATLAIVPQRGAGLWTACYVTYIPIKARKFVNVAARNYIISGLSSHHYITFSLLERDEFEGLP
jgi:hypothetical protein